MGLLWCGLGGLGWLFGGGLLGGFGLPFFLFSFLYGLFLVFIVFWWLYVVV